MMKTNEVGTQDGKVELSDIIHDLIQFVRNERVAAFNEGLQIGRSMPRETGCGTSGLGSGSVRNAR